MINSYTRISDFKISVDDGELHCKFGITTANVRVDYDIQPNGTCFMELTSKDGVTNLDVINVNCDSLNKQFIVGLYVYDNDAARRSLDAYKQSLQAMFDVVGSLTGGELRDALNCYLKANGCSDALIDTVLSAAHAVSAQKPRNRVRVVGVTYSTNIVCLLPQEHALVVSSFNIVNA